MNIETREIRDEQQLSEAEKSSGTWIPVRRKYARQYQQKQPISDADHARILAAHARRQRRALTRAATSAGL